jgi:CDP-diacylglycerol--glycerol-3-phosphate 3-phosphatidyltransferase
LSTDDVSALVAAGALLVTMPVYAIAGRGRARDADVAHRPRTAFLGYWVRDWLMWLIAPLERRLVARRVRPVTLNWIGVALGLAAGIAYARGALALGGWLVLLGGATDVLDGRIARARGVVSSSGAFLDSTLDRFAETFAYAGLAVGFATSAPAVLATAMALGGSLLVSYARARGEGLGVQFRGGLMQRAERVVLLGLASLFDPVMSRAAGWSHGRLLVAAVAVIAVASLGTAFYRTLRIARALEGGTPR